MSRLALLLAASLLLAACQSSRDGSTAGAGLEKETLEEAVARIERENARTRGGGP